MIQININKGLMNPWNKEIKTTKYLTKGCKGLMNPKSFDKSKNKDKKDNLIFSPYFSII